MRRVSCPECSLRGGENGDVILYDPAKIIAEDSDVVIAQSDKHSGGVRVDVNSFQTNLVASGGNESEIYIRDLNNFGSPMTPGPKTQPLEDVSCVAWNRQVKHILASARPSGRASIWNLRKNDLIIKVGDHSNMMHCSGLEWNPEVATQLVLASEDDRMPVIQIWDLRFATSPLKVLENHTRCCMSCLPVPSGALTSSGVPGTQRCCRLQPLTDTSAFTPSWGAAARLSARHRQTQSARHLATWIRLEWARPCPRCSFPRHPPTQPPPSKSPPSGSAGPWGPPSLLVVSWCRWRTLSPAPSSLSSTAHVVHVSQVITETAFLERSAQLQAMLAAGSFTDFCQEKIDAAQNEFDKTVWSFLKVNFENDARGKYLELLGYKKEELAAKIAAE